jgi:UDP-3-O-[3-hydroxymyristoyl] glucosamine N-acyltransferase
MPKTFSVSDVKSVLGDMVLRVSGFSDARVSKPNAIDRAQIGDLSFCYAGSVSAAELARKSNASILICGPEALEASDKTALIHVTNPRLAFVRALTTLFKPETAQRVSNKATIHPEAKIGRDVAIGDGCVVGRCEIGDGTRLLSNVVIHDNVTIGRNCHIKAGAVIGGDGFGFEENPEKAWEKFEHFGSVVIEDNVEIGSNTVIDRGALSETRIGQGTKIDSLVHIAHNVTIGRNTMIVCHATVGGSTKIGDSVWIAMGAMILNGIKLGNNVFVGIGANVTESVPDGHRVMPAFGTIKPPKQKDLS